MAQPDPLEQALAVAFDDADNSPPTPTPEADAAAPAQEVTQPSAPDGAAGAVVDADTTAPVPEPAEATAADEPGRRYVDKFTSVDELEAGYRALEAKLGDGDYRALKDEHDRLAQQLADMQAELRQQPTPPPTATPDWLDEEAFENPVQARELVLWSAAQQPWAFEKALGVWYEVDPRSAAAFEREVEREQWNQELNERLEPLQQLPERQAAEDRQAETTGAFETAWRNLSAANPDLGDYTDAIMEQAQTAPAVLAVFEGTDTAAMHGTLNLLLSAARARRAQADSVSQAQEQEAALAAKSRGATIRATSTAGLQAQPPPGPNDRFLEIFDQAAGFSDE